MCIDCSKSWNYRSNSIRLADAGILQGRKILVGEEAWFRDLCVVEAHITLASKQ